MTYTREELETQALETVSADLYYELADNMESMSDSDLLYIIACNGNYKKELELQQ
jgi:hypothetical protein